MAGCTLKQWVRKIWDPDEDDVSCLLNLDYAPIHKSPKSALVVKDVNTNLTLIPPGCTCLLQPVDLSWDKPFKAKSQENWANYLCKEENAKNSNLKKPSRQGLIRWVSHAWVSISEEMIRRSFKHCGITINLEGSENGELHSDLSRAYHSLTEELQSKIFDLITMEDDFDGFSEEDC